MIRCRDLTREDTDTIFKIIVREIKEMGLFQAFKNQLYIKDLFYSYITKLKGVCPLDGCVVEIYWLKFRDFGMSQGRSSFLLVKLLDNKSYVDLILKKGGSTTKLKASIKKEADYILRNKSCMQTTLNGFTKKELLSFKDIFIKYDVPKDLINNLDLYIKENYH